MHQHQSNAAQALLSTHSFVPSARTEVKKIQYILEAGLGIISRRWWRRFHRRAKQDGYCELCFYYDHVAQERQSSRTRAKDK